MNPLLQLIMKKFGGRNVVPSPKPEPHMQMPEDGMYEKLMQEKFLAQEAEQEKIVQEWLQANPGDSPYRDFNPETDDPTKW